MLEMCIKCGHVAVAIKRQSLSSKKCFIPDPVIPIPSCDRAWTHQIYATYLYIMWVSVYTQLIFEIAFSSIHYPHPRTDTRINLVRQIWCANVTISL